MSICPWSLQVHKAGASEETRYISHYCLTVLCTVLQSRQYICVFIFHTIHILMRVTLTLAELEKGRGGATEHGANSKTTKSGIPIRSIKRGISYTPHFMQRCVKVSGITQFSPKTDADDHKRHVINVITAEMLKYFLANQSFGLVTPL